MSLSIQELFNSKEIRDLIAKTAVSHRRALHRIPEPAWEESKTTAYIADTLRALGYAPITGPAVAGHETGVIAELKNGEGRILALRFDIDALPKAECASPEHFPHQAGFASLHGGRMHACGHDGHAAIGLTLATLLMEEKNRLPKGCIRLIFQPAEEGCRGALPLTEKGWLDDVDVFLSGHIVGRDYPGVDTAAAEAEPIRTVAITLPDAV